MDIYDLLKVMRYRSIGRVWVMRKYYCVVSNKLCVCYYRMNDFNFFILVFNIVVIIIVYVEGGINEEV